MITIGVFRVFGDELEQPVKDYEVALQLHNNRKQALHDVFGNQKDVEVLPSTYGHSKKRHWD